MNALILGFTFLLALLLAVTGTPIAKRVAHHYNLLDFPDGRLKKQREPVPYMGGVIVYFAFISPISLVFDFNQQLLGILFSSSILVMVGLFDDLKALSPSTKFFFQVIATYILLKSGIFLHLLFLPPWLATVLSFFWILSMINAFNIIDIMDGLASSIGAISTLAIFVIALGTGDFMIAILSLSLAAALIGFLKFNWEPAQIYLGDTGSMLIGLNVGALTIMADYSRFNSWAFVAGLLIPAVPLFDLGYVSLLRLLSGKSPFLGSPDHFALRLRKGRGWTSRRTVTVIALLQGVLAVIAVLVIHFSVTVTLVTCGVVGLFLVAFGAWLARVKMG
ncbi:MAG TPA: MraY family glycosyltransferase [Candidatus Aminicenantes bacterium]|nr:MraY family glycosyltransferase [Candidatus Aminicenantes bacterium]